MKKFSVVLLALVMAAAWTSSAFASATPYASVRFNTFYSDTSVEALGTDADAKSLDFGLFGTTRLGVKFKVSDEVSGLFEINSGVGLRHAFGVYDFGAGKLLIGQTWNPYVEFLPQVVNDLAGLQIGAFDTRNPQVRVTLDNGLYAALIQNGVTAPAGSFDDADAIDFPQVSIGYKGKMDAFSFGLHGSYAEGNFTNGANDTNASGYAIIGDLGAKLGGSDLKLRVYGGEDMGNIQGSPIMIGTPGGNIPLAATQGDETTYGFNLAATMHPSDMIAVSVGGGYLKSDFGDVDVDFYELFVNSPIKVTKGFTIVPEINYQNLDADDALEIDRWFVGAKWQFDL